MNSQTNSLSNSSQIIYIPEYVEQGIGILSQANSILEEIATGIERGISQISGSGYDGGIPYIEKGGIVAEALADMKSTINYITKELEKYNSGKKILPKDAIIIADPNTIDKYGLSKEDIDYTLEEYITKNPKINSKWSSNYLTAGAGSVCYYGQDGRYTKETWCDLNPNNLVKLMKKQGIDLDYWIRDDGVYMYGDYVMVAADIPHMDGTEQEAEYRKGDIVETSLGTGMVVDLCGMAESVRKGEFKGGRFNDVEVWYDIYTAWHDEGKYEAIAYADDGSGTSQYKGTSVGTMIEASSSGSGEHTVRLSASTPPTPTLISPETTSPQTTSTPVSVNSTIPTTTTPTTTTTESSPTPNQPIVEVTQTTYQESITPSSSNSTSSQLIDQNTTADSSKNPIKNFFTSLSDSITTPSPIESPTPIAPVESVNTNSLASASAPVESPLSQISVTEEKAPSLNDTNQIISSLSTSQVQQTQEQINTTNEESYVIPSPSIENTTKSSINSVSILTSLGLTTAAGVTAKLYADSKQNSKKDEQHSNQNINLDTYNENYSNSTNDSTKSQKLNNNSVQDEDWL